MQQFLASDVIYDARVLPFIQQTLAEKEIGGQPAAGLAVPAEPRVAERRARSPTGSAPRGGGGDDAAGSDEEPAPGLHGHGVVSTSVGDATLEPGETANRIPAGSDLAFTVEFANQGENNERNVTVQVRIRGDGRPIVARRRVEQTQAGANAEVSIPLAQAPPIGTPVTIEVSVARVPGEEKVDNNRGELHRDLHALDGAPDDFAAGTVARDELSSTTGIVALVAGGLALIAFLWAIWATVQLRRLRAAQSAVLGPGGSRDLVGHAAELDAAFRALHDHVDAVHGTIDERLAEAEQRLDHAIAYAGSCASTPTTRCPAGSRPSIALLDAHGSGIVVSSIHHRDQARVYAKQVRSGPRGELELAPEEVEAVRMALTAEPAAAAPDRHGLMAPPTSGLGTFSEGEALLASAREEFEDLPLATVHVKSCTAVQDGRAALGTSRWRARREGSARATLDRWPRDRDVVIVGEVVRRLTHALIARATVTRSTPWRVVGVAPQAPRCSARASCCRRRCRRARGVAWTSTAEAVRAAAGRADEGWAAIGTARAAELYGCVVLRDGIEDSTGNATRFAWLARGDDASGGGQDDVAHKTTILFAGPGTNSPGWLVRCLSEFAFRG
jgi:prephenate dehydratase